MFVIQEANQLKINIELAYSGILGTDLSAEQIIRQTMMINAIHDYNDKADLYGYGVAAKISGVEGRGTGEFALLVEGVARIKIDHITQDKPFFAAEVTYEYDDGKFGE